MDQNMTQESNRIERKSPLRWIIENVLYIAVAVGLALGVQHFIFRPFIVSGSSMDPTFKSNDYLIVDEISYRLHPPARGDVIIFKAPPEPNKYYIKRIIGLPGETVKIEGINVTIINTEHPEGITLSEKFITHPHVGSLTYKVPAHSYFVLGDNRAGSYDSREWGTVPEANIRGRAYLRLYPFSKISYLPGEEKKVYEGIQ